MSSPSLCAEQVADSPVATVGVDCTCGDHPTAHSRAEQQLRCVVYGPQAKPDGFTALAAEWNALLRHSRFNSLFLTHEWQTTWWRYQGEGDLWILAFRKPDTDELVGIVPLFVCFVSWILLGVFLKYGVARKS